MEFNEVQEIIFVLILLFFMAMSFVSLIFVIPVFFFVAYLIMDEVDKGGDEPDDDDEPSKTL